MTLPAFPIGILHFLSITVSVRDKDEVYWDEYKATPKAFIPLRTGKSLWKNRFGDLTSIRMGTAPGLDLDKTKSLFEIRIP